MSGRNPRADRPAIACRGFIDPTMIVCGRVVVEEDVLIGPCAVIRAAGTAGKET